MPDISKITMPSGTTYDIKDSVARASIGKISFHPCMLDADTPEGVTWTPAGSTTPITGTLAASSGTQGTIYLVYVSTTEQNIYDEYITVVTTSGGYAWEKLGSTKADLSGLVTEVTLTKATDTVVGTDATFTVTQPTVSVTTQPTATVTQPTISVTTQPTISVTPSTTYLGASASGGAVSVATTSSIDGEITYDGDTTDVYTSLSSAKLVTTSITPVNGTTSIKPPSLGTAISADDITAWSAGTASSWSFTVSDETLTIGGSNSSAPSLSYTARSIPNVSLGTAVDVAKAGTAVTVATGSVSSDGTGGTVVTDGETTNIEIPYNFGFSSNTTVPATYTVTNPTISLSSNSATATGRVKVATGISSASASGGKYTATNGSVSLSGGSYSATGGAVAFNSKDSVTVVKDSGTSITVTKHS